MARIASTRSGSEGKEKKALDGGSKAKGPPQEADVQMLGTAGYQSITLMAEVGSVYPKDSMKSQKQERSKMQTLP